MRGPRSLLLLVGMCVLIAGSGCRNGEFEEDQTLGGKTISKEQLNRGLKIFRRYCASCHGTDGKGTLSAGSKGTPPRNMTLGYYKFTSVEGDGLPLDEDLIRVVRKGLKGTQMLPFTDLSDEEVLAVVHYVKTFANRWRSEVAGKPVPREPDPWQGRRRAAQKRGVVVYHAIARCWECHPTYVHPSDILTWAQEEDRGAGKTPRISIPTRPEMERSKRIETRYGMVLPPDFLGDTLPAAEGVDGLYRAISAGVGGTPMPTWHGKLSTRDLWAVVHYVRELTRLRGSRGATLIRARARQPGQAVTNPDKSDR